MSGLGGSHGHVGLAALFQLASPMLPVGAFAYSQGIERAVEDGLIADAAGARRWIFDALAGPMATFEAPLWIRLYRACACSDAAGFAEWNERFLASRETFELRAETLQMGSSLAILARDLRIDGAFSQIGKLVEPTFPAAFAAMAHALDLDERSGLSAYLWGWLENQVAAALKSVPLGQLAGQRLLLDAHLRLAQTAESAMTSSDDDLVSAAPGLALTCALHETQYSRLFRS